MRVYITILILLSTNILLGQDSLAYNTEQKNNKTIEFINNTFTEVGSDHIPFGFFAKFLFGGNISEKEKGNLDAYEKYRRSGFEIDQEFGIKVLNSNSENGWYLNFQHLNSGAITYPQLLYNAVFDGNTNIENEISLDQMKFHYRKHQIFHIGIVRKNLEIGFAIGNILEENYGKLNTENQLLFNNPYEWTVDINPEMVITENTNNFLLQNGNSLGLDLRIFKKIEKNKGQFYYDISLKNIGVVILHNNIKELNYDTTFVYSGLRIEDLINIDSTLQNLSSDLEPQNINQNKIITSPFTFNSHFSYLFKNMTYYSTVFYRHNSQYLPKIKFGCRHNINKNISLGTQISYGGYTKFQWGSQIIIEHQKLLYSISINNLLGAIPSVGKSFGINFHLKWQII